MSLYKYMNIDESQNSAILTKENYDAIMWTQIAPRSLLDNMELTFLCYSEFLISNIQMARLSVIYNVLKGKELGNTKVFFLML